MFEYLYDKNSAANSRDALEYVQTRAALDPNVANITVLIHSMGNWITLEAFCQFAIRRGAAPSEIMSVITVAPDIDVDAFPPEYLELGTPKPRFSLFLWRDDNAPSIRRFFAGDKDVWAPGQRAI